MIGWDVGENGKSTEQVGQEIEVINQPTKTGIGYADYVLWNDNGTPLEVIEAKKTAISGKLGREQAKLYAEGLEHIHGKRPIVFYTNGTEIYIWNDNEPPRQLFGFYSKDSLQYLCFQQENKQSLDTLTPETQIKDV